MSSFVSVLGGVVVVLAALLLFDGPGKALETKGLVVGNAETEFDEGEDVAGVFVVFEAERDLGEELEDRDRERTSWYCNQRNWEREETKC